MPIQVSNLMLVDPKTGEATRIGHKFDDKGNIIGLVGIARDITEHKKAEERIAAERKCCRVFF